MNIRRFPDGLGIPQKLRARITPVIALAPRKAREAVLTAHTWNLVLRTDPVARGCVVAVLEEASFADVSGATGPVVEVAEERA